MKDNLEQLVSNLLTEIGEDTTRPGLIETPRRVAAAWREYLHGYTDPTFSITTFPSNYTGLIIRKNIPFQSFCEHHFARYSGVAHIAYIPNGFILGLSKIIRLLQWWSARLTVQEDLTDDLATRFRSVMQTDNVGVVIEALHSCEATRGVKVPNVPTITASLHGQFMVNNALRSEFYTLIHHGHL